jgi:hypothetical protein
VREQDEIGLDALDYLTQSDRESVRCVFFEQVVFDEENFIELRARELVGKRRNSFTDYQAREAALRVLNDLLSGAERFEADFVELAFALLSD